MSNGTRNDRRTRAAWFVVAVLVAFTPGSEAQTSAGMRVHFIDVGQGDATLIELPTGSILVDTGGEDNPSFKSLDRLTEYLDAFFERRSDLGRRLDLLIVTHPHPDHYRGVKRAWWRSGKVLRWYRPRNIVHNGQQPVAGWVEHYLGWQHDARAEEVEIAGITSEQGLTSDVIDPFPTDGSHDPRVRVLWGRVGSASGWCPDDFDDENNHSLVVRVDYGGASILFTGDLESSDVRKCDPGDSAGIERVVARYRTAQPNPLDVDVYQVGHHGSHNGTTADLVGQMTPLIAVISAGPHFDRGDYTAHDHGHPREITVQRLEDGPGGGVRLCRDERTVRTFEHYQQDPAHSRSMRRAIFSTGWDGTIVLLGQPNGFWSLERPAGSIGSC